MHHLRAQVMAEVEAKHRVDLAALRTEVKRMSGQIKRLRERVKSIEIWVDWA